jgi:hypothetical protein
MDEFHAPILPGQAGQNVGVEHEHGMHLSALPQGVVERGLIVGAQVAPEPDQAIGKLGLGRGVHRIDSGK